jgi:hypothetical protein
MGKDAHLSTVYIEPITSYYTSATITTLLGRNFINETRMIGVLNPGFQGYGNGI